ncbi:MAG: hypothetical protein WDN47_01260 [Candidatus Doudnabacteria bacterium]
MTTAAEKKNEYAKSVCYFLAEELRIRKISLSRAAEIAQKVVDNINLIDTEQDFLRLIKDLSSDFDELFQLEERIQFGIQISQRKQLEEKVREFVADILPQDTKMALEILQEAIREEIKAEDLRKDFPKFNQFLEKDKI